MQASANGEGNNTLKVHAVKTCQCQCQLEPCSNVIGDGEGAEVVIDDAWVF